MIKCKQLPRIFYRSLNIFFLLPLLLLLTSPNTYAVAKKPKIFNHSVKILDIQVHYDDQNKQSSPRVTFDGNNVKHIFNSNTNQYSVYTQVHQVTNSIPSPFPPQADGFDINVDGQKLLTFHSSMYANACEEKKGGNYCDLSNVDGNFKGFSDINDIPGISYDIKWSTGFNELYPGD